MNRSLRRRRVVARLRRFANARPLLVERLIEGGPVLDVHSRDFASLGLSPRLLEDVAGYPRGEARIDGAYRIAEAMGLGEIVRSRWAGCDVRAQRDRGKLEAYVDGRYCGEWRFR